MKTQRFLVSTHCTFNSLCAAHKYYIKVFQSANQISFHDSVLLFTWLMTCLLSQIDKIGLEKIISKWDQVCQQRMWFTWGHIQVPSPSESGVVQQSPAAACRPFLPSLSLRYATVLHGQVMEQCQKEINLISLIKKRRGVITAEPSVAQR